MERGARSLSGASILFDPEIGGLKFRGGPQPRWLGVAGNAMVGRSNTTTTLKLEFGRCFEYICMMLKYFVEVTFLLQDAHVANTMGCAEVTCEDCMASLTGNA